MNNKAYYICYQEEGRMQLGSEITQVYTPFEYVMAYWNKFNLQITLVWWKELTPEELLNTVKVGGIAMNLLR